MSDIIQKADEFAEKAHSSIGHVRKYCGSPYIIHPRAVAAIVKKHGGDDNMIAAALLHDTIEDTPVCKEDLIKEFGEDIADLVDDLSDISKPEDGNRATRKAIDREHTAMASARAQSIKCADLVHNTLDIVSQDKNFAVVYLKEKEEMLKVMNPSISSLYQLALDALEKGKKLLTQVE